MWQDYRVMVGRGSAGKHVSKGLCVINKFQERCCAWICTSARLMFDFTQTSPCSKEQYCRQRVSPPARRRFSPISVNRMYGQVLPRDIPFPGTSRRQMPPLISTAKRPSSFTNPPQHRLFTGVGWGMVRSFPSHKAIY